MTPRQRIDAALALATPDRTPILGGWIACPPYLMELAGATPEEYAADPQAVSLRGYRALGSDGLLGCFVPRHLDEYRCVDQSSYLMADRGMSFAAVEAHVDGLPTPEQVEAEWDFDAAYEPFRADLAAGQARAGDMVWMPPMWGSAARLDWYGQFGYQNWFLLFGLDEPRARKMLEVSSAYARRLSRLCARAVTEGLYPRAVLLGEDICDQRGPMIAVDFIERYYAPLLRYGLEPLLEAGCRPVWHSDGNVRPLLDMLIDCGVQGFQGFQPECGMTLELLVERRTRDGEPLVIFGPLAVTTELPRMTPEQVIARLHECIALCRGRAALLIFTGNTICPDTPLANILAMHEAVRTAG